MNYSIIVVAGGKGERMGLGYNKVFFQLKEGMTVLDTSLQIFLEDQRCKQIVIVTNQDDLQRIVVEHEMGRIVNVGGGPTRQESVFNGLMCVTEDVVLVHDAARPYLPIEALDRLLEALETEDAAILAVQIKDTIKEVKDDYIVSTVNRSAMRHAQTPQGFKTRLLLECMHKARKDDFTGTDDAQLIEKYTNTRVRVVHGSYANIKITTLEDIK